MQSSFYLNFRSSGHMHINCFRCMLREGCLTCAYSIIPFLFFDYSSTKHCPRKRHKGIKNFAAPIYCPLKWHFGSSVGPTLADTNANSPRPSALKIWKLRWYQKIMWMESGKTLTSSGQYCCQSILHSTNWKTTCR